MPKQIQPKVTFIIDKNNRNKNGLAPIKANITINYQNVRKIVDHVLPTDWNPKQQRVRPPRPGKTNNHGAINKILEKLQKDFNEFTRKCELNRIKLTPDVAKKFLKGESNLFEKEFWPAYKEYLSVKQFKQPKTLQNYTLYYTKLGEFEQDTGYYIDYPTINPIFFEKYQHYILNTKGLGWNTFATAIKKLKFFMNWSLKQNYHSETSYKEFSATEREPTIIFLTMKELTKLFRHDFKNKRLNQVRDRFCFGCFTGLAFSDLDSLTREHINNNTLTKLRNKTGISLDIELAKPAIEIIERYKDKYKALPKISNQKFNEYIKECCRILEINTKTVYITFPKGIKTENIAPKYELISSHIARKTFITYLYHITKDVILTAKIAGCSPDIIKKHYVGTDREMEKEAMKKAFGKL